MDCLLTPRTFATLRYGFDLSALSVLCGGQGELAAGAGLIQLS
jgi:hypothetical protein